MAQMEQAANRLKLKKQQSVEWLESGDLALRAG